MGTFTERRRAAGAAWSLWNTSDDPNGKREWAFRAGYHTGVADSEHNHDEDMARVNSSESKFVVMREQMKNWRVLALLSLGVNFLLSIWLFFEAGFR